MAGKFKIYCDDLQDKHTEDLRPAAAAAKREPLGLRQQPAREAAPAPTVAAVGHEDQENDISIASLGSDFVPSIYGDEIFDQSDSLDESCCLELDEQQEESDTNIECDEQDDYDLYHHHHQDNQDDDFDQDEELLQAFQRHDESQLFKSSIYRLEIESHLKQLERQPDLRPLPNYMDLQPEIDSDKRAILISWLIEVADEYNLQTETLFNCVSIIDRFLSLMAIPTSNFQLLGVASMFIASKYEEIYPPTLYQFVEVTDDTYSGQQIRKMEQEILKTLNFRISQPTISYFLKQIFAFNKFPKKVYHLAEYLCYLTLLADQPTLEYYPSEIALAAAILAAHQLDAATNISTDLKSAFDLSNIDQLQRQRLPLSIESLRNLQERAQKGLTANSAVVRFSSDTRDCVASLRPLSAEDLRRVCS